MNPNPRPPSEPPLQPTSGSQSFDTLLEGRYKARSILPWRSRGPAPYGTHIHRAEMLAGLALIALAVVGYLLAWPGAMLFGIGLLGALYLLLGLIGRP